MILDKKFEEQFLIVSSRAALAAYHLVGKKDKKKLINLQLTQ